MKILLIDPPHQYDDEGKNREPAYFPLGLGYIARTLLDSGYDVEILDIFALKYDKNRVIEEIKKRMYDAVGISALSPQYKYIKWLASELKKHHPDGKIILGGALAIFSYDAVLKNTAVDICVIGEGEITISSLLKNLKRLNKVKGIAYKEGKRIKLNNTQEYIRDLDTIKFPAWDLFPMDVYLNTPAEFEGYFTKNINIISARGCPYNCRFCSKTFSGARMRSVNNVIKEIKELKDRFDVGLINFSEELVMISKDRMYELCKKIRPLKIRWTCQGRVNTADYELLKEMKKAGCRAVGYGVESGSQTILDNMNKNATVEMAEKAVKATIKAGIRPVIQMMYGYPGETKKTLEETIDFCDKLHITMSGELSTTTPLPGTALYDDCIKKGLIKDEAKYLEKLQGTDQFLINLTKFPDKDFIKIKKDVERRIIKNYQAYVAKHPLLIIKDLYTKLLKVIGYMKKKGVISTIKAILNVVVKKPRAMLEPEY